MVKNRKQISKTSLISLNLEVSEVALRGISMKTTSVTIALDSDAIVGSSFSSSSAKNARHNFFDKQQVSQLVSMIVQICKVEFPSCFNRIIDSCVVAVYLVILEKTGFICLLMTRTRII